MTATLLFGVVRGCGGDASSHAPTVAAGSSDGAGGGPREHPAPVASHAPLPASPPVRLAVPRMVVEAPVIRLGLDSHGRLSTPPMSKPHEVGWYAAGPSPGQQGTAVIVGHRDTKTGPAIFLNLNALRPGDPVKVTRKDHRTAVFTVDSVRTFARGAFPSKKVYGDTGRPELRLLTCGGRFDRKTGYSANVVVFAHLTSVARA
ncbi:class F sortase [Streptomyces sp. NRRL F-5126]|uniref:class F sortase n=1 Tax=Streptomyces sp. NRRL F-5126 TaxID=1463857 RepID=UPI000AF4C825